jgi:hypothetical protein
MELVAPGRPERDQEREFEWVLQGGLGPLLHHAAGPRLHEAPQHWRERLLAADLTARIRHADLVATASEAIDACHRVGVTPILLKGISTSHQFYPAAHLRPMGDVDVMILPAAYASVESAMSGSFARFGDEAPVAGLQHGPPLLHGRLGTIVELHTKLFSDTAAVFDHPLPWRRQQLFTPGTTPRSVPSEFNGRPVHRLDAETQLVYIASSWFNDLTHHKVHPSFVPSMFDAVFLLRASGDRLDWDAMPRWIDNAMAKAFLHSMLTYLPRFGIERAPRETLAWLSSSQSVVGPLQLRVIHWMLDRHLVGGRPWTWFLPPPVPGRYNPLHQIAKRAGRVRQRVRGGE